MNFTRVTTPPRDLSRIGAENRGFSLSWFEERLHQGKTRFQLIGRRRRIVLQKDNRLIQRCRIEIARRYNGGETGYRGAGLDGVHGTRGQGQVPGVGLVHLSSISPCTAPCVLPPLTFPPWLPEFLSSASFSSLTSSWDFLYLHSAFPK